MLWWTRPGALWNEETAGSIEATPRSLWKPSWKRPVVVETAGGHGNGPDRCRNGHGRRRKLSVCFCCQTKPFQFERCHDAICIFIKQQGLCNSFFPTTFERAGLLFMVIPCAFFFESVFQLNKRRNISVVGRKCFSRK